jgi:hypothetical protein
MKHLYYEIKKTFLDIDIYIIFNLLYTANIQPAILLLSWTRERDFRSRDFNFQTNTKELFFSDSVYYGAAIVSWDPTQQWIFLTQDNSYSHMNPDDYAMLTGVVNASSRRIVHVFPDQYPHPPGTLPHSFNDHFEDDKIVNDGIVYNPVKNVFYVTWCLPYPDTVVGYHRYFAYQRTAVYDATTLAVLDTLTVPPGWITAQASVSEDGNYLYLVNWEDGYPTAIGKYSLATKQLIINRNLSDIVVPGIRKGFSDSKKGKYLIGYRYPSTQTSDRKHALYNIDLDTSVIIPFQEESHISISSDAKYVIIEETPLKPDYLKLNVPSDELYDHPGRISVFNGITGQLIQKLTLPPDGKVLVFDNYPNMLYYYLPKQNRSINIDLSQLGPDTCTVKLLSSTGSLLTNGTLQYRDSAWENAVNNNDGTFTFTTTRKKVSLRMTYAYGTQTKSNVTIKNNTVIIFQTKNVAVNLQNSQGAPLDTGIVEYNSGGWRSFGTTLNGTITKELLPTKYTFRMTYNGATVSKAQNIDSNATVIFQTVPAKVQLQTSTGAPLDTGIVQFNASGWKNFGTTLNGVVTKELLPTKYTFRMTYDGATVSKAQSIDSNATVVFQTVKTIVQFNNSKGNPMPAPLGDTGIVQFNSGGWKDFGITSNGVVSKELLPVKYTFRLTYNGSSVSIAQNVDSNATVVFSTVLCTVSVTNTAGSLLNNAIVSYNAGGWKVIGTTVNGIVIIELLPVKIQFRAAYGSKQQSVTQDVSTNPFIAIILPIQ